MSRVVKKELSFFQLFLVTSKTQRKVLLDTITNEQLRALSEITANLLRSNLTITPAQKKKLRRHKKLYLALGSSSASLRAKKKLLCRQGHAIALLLKSVESSLKSFLP